MVHFTCAAAGILREQSLRDRFHAYLADIDVHPHFISFEEEYGLAKVYARYADVDVKSSDEYKRLEGELKDFRRLHEFTEFPLQGMLDEVYFERLRVASMIRVALRKGLVDEADYEGLGKHRSNRKRGWWSKPSGKAGKGEPVGVATETKAVATETKAVETVAVETELQAAEAVAVKAPTPTPQASKPPTAGIQQLNQQQIAQQRLAQLAQQPAQPMQAEVPSTGIQQPETVTRLDIPVTKPVSQVMPPSFPPKVKPKRSSQKNFLPEGEETMVIDSASDLLRWMSSPDSSSTADLPFEEKSN